MTPDKLFQCLFSKSKTLGITPVTYEELVELRSTSSLIPGMQYRITDYETITIQDNTDSANHQFDIIVTADSANTLNENARACLHSGDTYFSTAGAKLEAWKLKYCLDNDMTKFAWIDPNYGKGVIYYMKDEWDNECPYDFKNILFKRFKITDSPKSTTLVGLYTKYGPINTGVVIDATTTYWCYTFSMINLIDNVIDDVSVYQKKYLSDSQNPYDLTYGNVLGKYIRDRFGNTVMLLPDNVMVTDTTICDISYEGGGFHGYSSNTIKDGCLNITLGHGCRSNTLGNGCEAITFGNNCTGNILGTRFNFGIFGNGCEYNTFGGSCWWICFESDCEYNTFGSDCRRIDLQKQFTRYITVESGNKYITITSTQTTNSINDLRNFTIAQGVNDSGTAVKTISHNTTRDNFRTVYQPVNSQTVDV